MTKTKLKFRKAKVLKVMKQTPNTGVDRIADSKRTALKAGLRISKTGHIYYERRQNRSDVNPKNKL